MNDIVGDNVKKLAQVFPAVVKDGEVDFEALKEELEQVEQLRFIFTSPTFIKDKSKKEKLKTLENN